MRIALAIGDANGIGPELAAKLLAHADMAEHDVIIIGDARIFEMGQKHAGVSLDIPIVKADELINEMPAGKVFADLENFDPNALTLGESTAEAGMASLQNFAAVLRLADAGIADVAMETIATLIPGKKGNFRYAIGHFKLGDPVLPKEMMRLAKMRTAMQQAAKAMGIVSDDYMNDDTTYTDVDTEEDFDDEEPF